MTTITTEEAEQWAKACEHIQVQGCATALRSLAAERDALKADLLAARNGAVAASENAGRMMEERNAAWQEMEGLQAENARLRAALILARIAVSHACEDSGRLLYTQDLARIDAALGEKE